MTDRTCSIDGCANKYEARGYCNAHYKKLMLHGDPLAGGRHYKTPEESLKARSVVDGDCLIWVGSVDGNGYGQIKVGPHLKRTHRYAWELANGAIPDGMGLDHKCHNKRCLKLEHLRVTTPKQNAEHVRGAYAHNKTSGILGVSWSEDRQKWVAQVHHNGRAYHAGRFSDIEDAAEAARLKRLELFTHNDHDRAA